MLQAQGIVEYLTKRLGLDKLGVDGRTTPSLAESPVGFGLNAVVNGLSLSDDFNIVVGSGRGVEEQERVWEARRAKGRELGKKWRDLTAGQERLFDKVTIALVGKYTDLKDSYMSVTKALEHSAFRVHRKLTIQWVESSDLEPETQESHPAKYHDAWRAVVGAEGILVPGGFGHRGTDGMMLAIKYAREQKVPFLGICLGFQLAVVEWAKNVLSIPEATSAEFTPNATHPLIVFMPEISKTHMGGTMRLGLRPTVFGLDTEKWSKMRKLYGGAGKIWERHRHRYEVNPVFVDRLMQSGMVFAGKDEKGERMQVCELRDHPFFVGLQAHPEFCTRPLNPSPPFLGFVAAACGPSVLEEQIALQMANYTPPHPAVSMVSEAALKSASEAVEAAAQEARNVGGPGDTDEESKHMVAVMVINEDR